MVGDPPKDTLLQRRNNTSRTLGRSPNSDRNNNTNTKTSCKQVNPTDELPVASKKSAASLKVFTANYRKRSNKKNKTWEGDGYAYLVSDEKLKFYNEGGNTLGTALIKDNDIYETVWRVGSNEIQIDYRIDDDDEMKSVKTICRLQQNTTAVDKNIYKEQKVTESVHVPKVMTKFKSVLKPVGPTNLKPTNSSIKPANQQSTLPPLSQEIVSQVTYSPMFDPFSIDNPLIMNKCCESKVDVIVDPILSKSLRTHQRQGIKFLYDCVMNLVNQTGEESLLLKTDEDIKGCLLADEMGLGKTLMTITLIWTLLKQTPYPTTINQRGMALTGTISKVLIVCPVTLITNWKKEFKKWLPMNKIGVLTLNNKNTPVGDKAQVKNFLKVPRTYQVLIVGYEKLLSIKEELESDKDKLDLLVCDEGHRLKNKDSKILKILQSLEIEKKIVLSGTPIQNDLEEFFTIIDFINPGILGSFNMFKKEFIAPIMRSRDVNAKYNDMIMEMGKSKSTELIEMTKKFILRRTNEILSQYLPPKVDLIIFCKPTSEQILAFQQVLTQGRFNFNQMTFNSSLGLITLFKKICNSTSLLNSDAYYKERVNQKKNLIARSDSNSGKLKVLMSLLDQVKNFTEEKVVIISNYTQTLDIIESLCSSEGYITVRLDGSTSTKLRDKIVTSFNQDPAIFIFLLSAKSGGVGLNLIGASRLVLYDNDWNPSIDLQAMSRIHRDGQKKPCFIYRLVTTGCIDEKILQRQLMKIALSKKFLGDGTGGSNNNEDDLFQQDELKDLFTINTSTKSNTHDLICSCNGEGMELDDYKDFEVALPSSVPTAVMWTNALEAKRLIEKEEELLKKSKNDLMKSCLLGYKHIDPERTDDMIDDVINKVFEHLRDVITYAFVKDST